MGQTIAASGSLDVGWHLVPVHARVRNGQLEWAAQVEREIDHATGLIDGWRLVQQLIAAEALQDFVKLATAPDTAFMAFARKYGVLMLDDMGSPLPYIEKLPQWYERDGCMVEAIPALPSLPAAYPPSLTRTEVQALRERERGAIEWRSEPLDAWRDWARYFRAFQILARTLRRRSQLGQTAIQARELHDFIPNSDKELFDSWPNKYSQELMTTLSLSGLTIAGQWNTLILHANRNLLTQPLVRASISPIISGPVDSPRLALEQWRSLLPNAPYHPESLFPVLAGALAASLLDTSPDASEKTCLCSVCGTPYICRRSRLNGRCKKCHDEDNRKRNREGQQRKRAAARSTLT